METRASHFIQDQNFNVHFDGAPVVGKGNVSKAQKKGGLGGRKALNDISNSGKPSALQPSRKHNSMNVISIGEDLGVSKTKVSVGGKINVSNAPGKAQVGGRKALGDLTNSGKPPSALQVTKKSQGKKLTVAAENEKVPSAVAEECFLHNHQKCIKSQSKAIDLDYFLKTVGLDDDFCMQLATPRAPLPSLSRNSKQESSQKHLIMEEILELIIEDQSPHCGKVELSREHNSAVSSSRKPFIHWEENNFSDFVLVESP